MLDDYWLWGILAVTLAALWLLHGRSARLLSLLPGFALLALIGFCNAALAVHRPLAQPLRRSLEAAVAPGESSPRLLLEGRVITLPKHKNGHLRFMLQVERYRPWLEIPPLPEGFHGPRAPLVFPAWVPAAGSCLLYVRCPSAPDIERADRVRIVATLEEVLPPRNYGEFDYRSYLIQRGTVLTGYAPSAYSLRRISEERTWYWVWLSQLRQRLVGELERSLPAERAELAISAVYGDKITDLDEGLKERFRRSGLSHILVASGTQVSLLIALVLTLGLRGWRLGPMLLRAVLTLGVVLVYAVLAGLETSIVRALVMGIVVLLSRLTRREADGLTALAQAAIIVVMADPLQLYAAGFQLSFAATFGLIYINGITLPVIARETEPQPLSLPADGIEVWRGRMSNWLRNATGGLRKGALAALSTTAGAQLFVLPVLIDQFNQLSVWGLFSNAVAVPISVFLLISGALLSFGLAQLPLLGAALVWCVSQLCLVLDSTAGFFASLRWSDLAMPRLAFWQVACLYGTIFCIGEWLKLRARQTQPGSTLEQRRMDALVWLAGLASLALIGSALVHYVLPRPALAALALPGSEAYIWTSNRGAHWLFVSPKGLSRSKNAEVVVSAVRSRGINELRGLVWLGNMPARDPLSALRGPRFDLSALPQSSRPRYDPQWLPASSMPQCLCVTLGRGLVTIPLPESRGGLEVSRSSAADFVLLSARQLALAKQQPLPEGHVWPPIAAVDPAIHGLSQTWLSSGATVIESGSELRIVPVGGGLRLKSRWD